MHHCNANFATLFKVRAKFELHVRQLRHPALFARFSMKRSSLLDNNQILTWPLDSVDGRVKSIQGVSDTVTPWRWIEPWSATVHPSSPAELHFLKMVFDTTSNHNPQKNVWPHSVEKASSKGRKRRCLIDGFIDQLIVFVRFVVHGQIRHWLLD